MICYISLGIYISLSECFQLSESNITFNNGIIIYGYKYVIKVCNVLIKVTVERICNEKEKRRGGRQDNVCSFR